MLLSADISSICLMMNCLSHLKDFLIYFHAIWPHEPSFSSGKLIDENENITRMSSYLKKFLTSFDQINFNERNEHLAIFFTIQWL